MRLHSFLLEPISPFRLDLMVWALRHRPGKRLGSLGRILVFPGDDAGTRKNLQRWLNLARPLDCSAVRRAPERWRPYSGLVSFHPLLNRLADAIFLAAGTSPPLTGRGNHTET